MIPAHEMASPTFTMGLPLSVKLVEIISHRYALVILNPTKLTTEISHRPNYHSASRNSTARPQCSTSLRHAIKFVPQKVTHRLEPRSPVCWWRGSRVWCKPIRMCRLCPYKQVDAGLMNPILPCDLLYTHIHPCETIYHEGPQQIMQMPASCSWILRLLINKPLFFTEYPASGILLHTAI